MRRRIPGLQQRSQNGLEVPEGTFLTRVDRVLYCHHWQKPFFSVRFVILKPEEFGGRTISGRLYATQKALWKLNWFLHDFEYDADLLDHEEVDEKALVVLFSLCRLFDLLPLPHREKFLSHSQKAS